MIIYIISFIIIFIFVLFSIDKKIKKQRENDLLNNIDKHFEQKRKNKKIKKNKHITRTGGLEHDRINERPKRKNKRNQP